MSEGIAATPVTELFVVFGQYFQSYILARFCEPENIFNVKPENIFNVKPRMTVSEGIAATPVTELFVVFGQYFQSYILERFCEPDAGP